MKMTPIERTFRRMLLYCVFMPIAVAGSEYPKGQWVDLVDEDLSHWRGYRMTEVPAGWKFIDGSLVRSFRRDQIREEFADGGGDLMSRARFADFEFEFEFNVEAGGNSGVMYRVTEAESRSYWTGPEFQILEREDRKSDPAFHFSGANYALHGPERDVSKGAGQWNQARIKVVNGVVEHWLNGELVVAYELGSEDWKKRISESKFRTRSAYGVQPKGHIVLQDHGAEVKLRNVRIRALDDHADRDDDFSNRPWWSLFNGQNFDNWRKWLGVPHRSVEGLDLERDADGNYVEALGFNEDPKGVYSIVDLDGEPVIRISGEIYGALTTQQAFDNFHLKLEYKWGAQKWEPRLDRKRDSGLIYYAIGNIEGPFPEKSFMRSLECQIQEGDTGDLFLLFAPFAEVPVIPAVDEEGRTRMRFDENGEFTRLPNSGSISRVLKGSNAELPNEEWNTVEVICANGQIVHRVNGRVVMYLRNPTHLVGRKLKPLKAGKIQIQSEGAEVFYRNINLKLIDELPKEIERPK